MSRRTGRGSTRRGRPSPLPGPGFEAPPLVRGDEASGLVVDFRGEDGRSRAFDVGSLPMPGWHLLLAEALALRIGHAGGYRTLKSAENAWGCVGRWANWLATLESPPATAADCRREHVDAFHDRTEAAVITRHADTGELRRLAGPTAIRTQLPAEVWDAFNRRVTKTTGTAVGGYSDGEWGRLVAAARADSARILRRIRAGEDLLRRYRADPAALTEEERVRGGVLAHMANTGEVVAHPDPGQGTRREMAAHLFLQWNDLPALLILMAVLAERNGESVKELPAKHRLLEDRVVEVVLVKRRTGENAWFETVAWEIGPPGRELHTPGGFYLALLGITARSRSFCGSPTMLCLWRDGRKAKVSGPAEHYAPFEKSLNTGGRFSIPAWAANRSRPLLADPVPAAKTTSGGGDSHVAPAPAEPLKITFNRIKTSADVRRTKRLGGHLPSAAKSNTAQVLFTHYLRPDATTRDWAEGVMQDALRDAEETALRAHEEAALRAHEMAKAARGGGPRVIPGPGDPADLERAGVQPAMAELLAAGGLDTAWTACDDHDHHPVTDLPCGDSFLDCFHCGNCLVTRSHLPHLLALLDALIARYQAMDQEHWWQRYGPAWAAAASPSCRSVPIRTPSPARSAPWTWQSSSRPSTPVSPVTSTPTTR
ncbi:hypothetical protein [Streptomyces erythrochromogenes]|uniref:hypothetical protein n=1 Tax=Streptomyces erythrochromogenes TaxID=285574 RepID=UPI003825FF5F